MWGKSGQGGVAGCMTWGYETPRDPPTQDEMKWRRNTENEATYKNKQTQVKLDTDAPKVASSRANAKGRPGSARFVGNGKAYTHVKTILNKEEATQTPPYEDVTLDGIITRRDASTTCGDIVGTNRSQKASSRGIVSTRSQGHGKKVDFGSDFIRSDSRSSTHHRQPTPKLSGPSDLELAAWQDEVDDLLLERKADQQLRDTYLRSDSAFNYDVDHPDYFELWKQSLKPSSSAPCAVHHEGNSDSKWAMSKHRKFAKSKVDCHWDKDPILRPKSSRPDSRVKVKFDCPEESDMLVSVMVQKKKPPFL